MKIYTFKQTQLINASLETVWNFFSTPDNLHQITPPKVNFKTLLQTGGPSMYSGQLISYKLSPLPWLRVRWTTEIKNVVPMKYFADDQKSGPFSMWYHQHNFQEKAGQVEMIDEVCYALPLGFLGRLVNFLLVEREVNNIFKFRAEALDKIFPKKSQN